MIGNPTPVWHGGGFCGEEDGLLKCSVSPCTETEHWGPSVGRMRSLVGEGKSNILSHKAWKYSTSVERHSAFPVVAARCRTPIRMESGYEP